MTVTRLKRHASTGGGIKVELNDMEIALFRYRENVYAIKERCPHAGKPEIEVQLYHYTPIIPTLISM